MAISAPTAFLFLMTAIKGGVVTAPAISVVPLPVQDMAECRIVRERFMVEGENAVDLDDIKRTPGDIVDLLAIKQGSIMMLGKCVSTVPKEA